MINLPGAAVVALLLSGSARVASANDFATPAVLVRDALARATLDTAIRRMGGIDALRSIERMRIESITEWQRTSLDNRPHPYVASYEWSTELRDYKHPAWRYTRRFAGASGWSEIIDLVVDSVAAVKSGGTWTAQNVAYVDERTEVFTFAPERIVVLANDDVNTRALPDTTMNGTRYARVRTTVNGFNTTLLFGKGDGLLAEAQFRAAQPRDFGLAGWGVMDVSISYSRWQRMRDVPVNLPTQLDIFRVGKPYKRITIVGATVNAAIPSDSISVPDTLRRAFLARGNRAMFDLPVDTARITDSNFAVFGTPGTPSGAIKIGGRWILVEPGTAQVSAERSVAFLARTQPTSAVAGVIYTFPTPQAGLVWLAERNLKLWVTEAAKPYANATLRGWKRDALLTEVRSGSWIKVGGDSARVESLDLPDFPGTPVIYVPSLRWLYAAPAVSPLLIERIGEWSRQRGWAVDRIGSARDFVGVAMPR